MELDTEVCLHLQEHMQMSTSRTGKISIRSVDCVNVHILVVTLYYSLAKCYHWGELGKVYKGSLCPVPYNCKLIIISTKKIYVYILRCWWSNNQSNNTCQKTKLGPFAGNSDHSRCLYVYSQAVSISYPKFWFLSLIFIIKVILNCRKERNRHKRKIK